VPLFVILKDIKQIEYYIFIYMCMYITNITFIYFGTITLLYV